MTCLKLTLRLIIICCLNAGMGTLELLLTLVDCNFKLFYFPPLIITAFKSNAACYKIWVEAVELNRWVAVSERGIKLLR